MVHRLSYQTVKDLVNIKVLSQNLLGRTEENYEIP